WDYEKGIAHSDLMSADEMRAWAAAGMEVGSHTLDHPFLPKLSPDIAAFQIRQSKQELEEIIGAEVTAFCYPYGGESPEIRKMVRDAGYTNATTTERGLVRDNEDLFGLPRATVARSTNIVRFLQKCMTRLEEKKRRIT